MMPAPHRPPILHLSGLLCDRAEVPSDQDPEVHGLATDSRALRAGEVFLACAGARAHGLSFAAEAARAGAVAIVFDGRKGDAPAGLARELGLPVIAAPGLSAFVGELADRYHGHPSRALRVAGVTGTNGKTSCSQFLAQALDRPASRCGVIGTLGYGLYDELAPGAYTTPEPLALHGLLAELRDRGAGSVAMEVSSHGLAQGRVAGVAFELALWTNLTRDHLDYHGDMERYFEAKRRLFTVPGLRHAVVNSDDVWGRVLLDALPSGLSPLAFGLGSEPPAGDVPYVRGSDLRLHPGGFELQIASPWGEGRLHSRLLGRFNATNLLGVLAALLALGMPLAEALARLAETRTVPGRLECFGGGADRPRVVVDYAHTPDALEQVLSALREHCTGELWCVFGCGGERDAGKRPLMGAVAERLADRLVVTDDNPRGEDATQIVVDILAGLHDPDRAYVQRDRAEAIGFAVRGAHAGDVVLVAGKGHEDYQLIAGERRPFSDRLLARRLAGGVAR
jgi:UDP-N-acetylmuramoyl-L-alanyl-D-glutamate--2,6-diaminopimelate ligase